VLRELELMNPWWAGSGAGPGAGLPAFQRRLFPKLCEFLAPTSQIPGVLMVGFRRIGKTVLAKQWLAHAARQSALGPRRLVYADFQEMALGDAGPLEVVEAALSAHEDKGPLYVVLDEIQFVDKWDRKLRAALQRHGSRGVRILATGSGSAALRTASGDTLLDRARLLQLGPMPFAEWIAMHDLPPDAPREAMQQLFERYLDRGGFPAFAHEEGRSNVRDRIRELCEQYVIDSDLGRRLAIRSRKSFASLWLHFVHSPGLLLDWSKLPKEFRVARETFEQWVLAMLQAELIVELEPSQTSGAPLRGRKRYSKIYPIDQAVSGAYGIIPDEGPGLETLVFRQLRDLRERLRERHRLSADLTYWRDDQKGSAGEVDFRLHAGDVALLVEAKASRQVRSEDTARLASVARRLGLTRALVVCRGPKREVFLSRGGERVEVHCWPVAEFLLAADRCTASCEELFE
jgi:predicted AAA+ superfamily ATPase